MLTYYSVVCTGELYACVQSVNQSTFAKCCVSSTVLSVKHVREELEYMIPIAYSRLDIFERSVVSGMKSVVCFIYMMIHLYQVHFWQSYLEIHLGARTVYVEKRGPQKVRIVIGMYGRKIALVLCDREYNWDQRVGRCYTENEFTLF